MILSLALISSGVFGQFNGQKAVQEKNSYPRGAYEVEIPVNNDREVFWTNTFSDPNDWEIGDFGPVGLNWEIGTGLETGGAATIATINSESYGDGVAMVDSDEWANQTAIENCWFQTANPIDCSEHEFVHIEFSNQYYMWDGGASDGNEYCLLEVSTDGETWPDVETYEVADADSGTRFECWPNMQTQDFVANPTRVRFDISEVAGGEEEVYIRFRWVGTYGYAWFVDDIEIFDGAANDISIEGTAFAANSVYSNINGTRFVALDEVDGETVLGYEYFQYPEAQRPQIAALTPAINWGEDAQTDVVLAGEFNGVTNMSDPVTIEGGASVDSLEVSAWDTDGLAVGDYDFNLSISGELEDGDLDNNSSMASLTMTDYIMARDDNLIRGNFPGSASDPTPWIAGSAYEIFEDAEIYAVDFALTAASAPGEELIVQIYDHVPYLATEDGVPELLAESDEVIVWEGNYNGFGSDVTWVTVVLDDALAVTAGDIVLAAVLYESGSQLMTIAEAQSDAPAGSSVVFGDFGGNGIDWYFTNDLIMTRLNFDPMAVTSVGNVEASNFSLGQNVPNPAEVSTSITYNLEQNADVQFEILDITGKVIYTMTDKKAAGQYEIEYDVTSLPSGVYNYSLQVNGEKLTKRMIVK